ncbi:protein phosphatase 2C domain-containing protein [Sphaerimonospora thailandensis]|uniref:PPM-type phosphatase domain-containing protein n=1 Tax=Sphaerimonospora thailandensis TaxID=795644 RepID=A0A8J3W213_9ACTN|nr:protein phosphatase 2C domain-containing protein [Sphaerimonospora thailandensis]GIH72316.1 hypothetical protein Mth01_45690 [Sphaerimonospora thailandensis]
MILRRSEPGPEQDATTDHDGRPDHDEPISRPDPGVEPVSTQALGTQTEIPPRERGAEPQPAVAAEPVGVPEEPPSPQPPVFQAPPEYGKPHERAGKPRGIPEIGRAAPDMVVDGADFRTLTVRGASLRGDDHRYSGTTRQDSMGLWTLRHPWEGEVLLACVADGVGSQPLSHRGSELACRLLRAEVEPYVADLLDVGERSRRDEAARQLIERVALRMRGDIQDFGTDPRTLSTTLVVALVELTSVEAPRNCFVFGVGDSTALLLRDGAFRGLWTDKHGDGAISDSRTDALPGHVGSVATAEARLGGDDALVICTDGLANPMRGEEVEEHLVRQWSSRPVPGLLEFAWQLSFRAKSYGDDRTAVCVWGR